MCNQKWEKKNICENIELPSKCVVNATIMIQKTPQKDKRIMLKIGNVWMCSIKCKVHEITTSDYMKIQSKMGFSVVSLSYFFLCVNISQIKQSNQNNKSPGK